MLRIFRFSTPLLFFSMLLTWMMANTGYSGLVLNGDIVIRYNSTGPDQFNFGTGITQSFFQIYDRTNELDPFPPLLSSTPSSAGDALSHAIVLGGPLRVTNLNYNPAGLTLNDIWSAGQTLSVNGRTRFEVDAAPGTFITFGDYNVVNQAGVGLVFRDTGLGGLANLWNTSNVTINSVDSGKLQISGDLLLHSDQFGFLGAAPGTNVGSFTITAFSAVPEPSSFALLGLASVGIPLLRKRKNRTKAN